jgi:hypothetical protein
MRLEVLRPGRFEISSNSLTIEIILSTIDAESYLAYVLCHEGGISKLSKAALKLWGLCARPWTSYLNFVYGLRLLHPTNRVSESIPDASVQDMLQDMSP